MTLTPRVLPLALAAALTLVGLAAPAQAAPIRPLIQGVVVDQGGRYVDDVRVLAVRPDGTVAASALSYASDRPDGPQHGYFFLAVGEPGDYTVTLAKTGYRSADLGESVVGGRRGVVSLGEVELERRPAASTTGLRLADATLTTQQRGTAAVTVTTAGQSRPTGEVAVSVDGRRVDTVDLRSRDRGRVEVDLPRLGAGRHTVKASWVPDSPYVAASSSPRATLTVRKPGRQRAAWQRVWSPGSPLLRLLP